MVIEDGIIVDVGDSATDDADVEIDAGGRFVLPGLIAGHVHFRLATLDFRALMQWSEVQFGINMARLADETVRRGFATVRDLGGDVRMPSRVERDVDRCRLVRPVPVQHPCNKQRTRRASTAIQSWSLSAS